MSNFTKYYEWKELPKEISSQKEAREFLSTLKELEQDVYAASMVYAFYHRRKIVELYSVQEGGAMQNYSFSGTQVNYHSVSNEEIKQQLNDLSKTHVLDPDIESLTIDGTRRKLLLAWKIFMSFEPDWLLNIDLWGRMISKTSVRIIIRNSDRSPTGIQEFTMNVETEELEEESYPTSDEVNLAEYTNIKYW